MVQAECLDVFGEGFSFKGEDVVNIKVEPDESPAPAEDLSRYVVDVVLAQKQRRQGVPQTRPVLRHKLSDVVPEGKQEAGKDIREEL